jgi:hypothetical protein
MVRSMVGTAAPAVAPSRDVKPAWLFGRTVDTVLIANWWWPLLAVAISAGGWVHSGLTWWQLYLMSSPHRWITLPLVFGEADRVRAQWRRFVLTGLGLLALGSLLLALGLSKETGIAALGLFMGVDYVWNSWHFASQGAGISRIYGRSVAPQLPRPAVEREKSLFRIFVIWVFLRLAIVVGATSGQTRVDLDVHALDRFTRWGDFVALGVGAVLILQIARCSLPGKRAQLSYAGSFITLYAALLVALHTHHTVIVAYLAFASAIFHASEYLAVCSWAASRKRSGLWRRPVVRSTWALLAFIAVVGGLNWAVAVWSIWAWATMTLFVSLLHYGYDGMIWRSSPSRKVALT